MADLDQLQSLDREIRVAERQAVERLAAHLGEAIRDLPSESRLALVFVRRARDLQACASESTPSLGADHYLREIGQEFQDLQDDGEEE
jgi:hypothetical protein